MNNKNIPFCIKLEIIYSKETFLEKWRENHEKSIVFFSEHLQVLRNRFQKKRALAFKKETDSLSFHKKAKRFVREHFFYWILYTIMERVV